MARFKMFNLDNPRTPTQRGWKTLLSNEGGQLRRYLGFDGSIYGDESLSRTTDKAAFTRALEDCLQRHYCPACVDIVNPADGGARVIWVSARCAERHDKAVWLMRALGFEEVPGAFQWYRLAAFAAEAGTRI